MRLLLVRLLVGVSVGAVALVATAPAAVAHGDPSGHYLESGVLYPAIADPPTQETELSLLGLLLAARDNGYPIKVALVANEQDLTDDATMLDRPQAYADYVASLLLPAGALPGPVLVVTPRGFGLAGNVPLGSGSVKPLDRDEAAALVAGLEPVTGTGGEALAQAAAAATRDLAAEAGHALPAYVPPAEPVHPPAATPASEDGGFNLWLALAVFLGVFGFAALLYEAQRRFSAEETTAAISRGTAEQAGHEHPASR